MIKEKRISIYLKIIFAVCLFCAMFFFAQINADAAPARPGTEHENGEGGGKSHSADLITLDDIPEVIPEDIYSVNSIHQAPSAVTEKNIPLLIIVMGFNNISYVDDYDWHSQVFEGEKSLRQYYLDQSFGQFTFEPALEISVYDGESNTNIYDDENDGIVHVSVDRDHLDWSGLEEKDEIEDMLDAFRGAIEKADEYVDFSYYDIDGSGKITTDELAIGFVVAGYEASAVDEDDTDDTYIWSHAYSYEDAIKEYNFTFKCPAPDGVSVSDYIAVAENTEEGTVIQTPINLLAHELGHYIGLPDLYDTAYDAGDWSSWEVGKLSLMANGIWGADLQGNTQPYSFDIWSKYMLGWVDPVIAETSGTYYLNSTEYYSSEDVSSVIIQAPHNDNEYYILENRQGGKWDARLINRMYSNGGIIIWHIDDEVYNEYNDDNAVNDSDHRPAVMPLYIEYGAEENPVIGYAPDLNKGFFNSSVWSGYSAYGSELMLPAYGYVADDPDSRLETTIGVKFDSASSKNMTININVDSRHTLYPVEGYEADCENNGLKDHYECMYCEKMFEDKSGTREITDADLVIPATGHDWDSGIITKKPTTTATGIKTYTCKNDSSHTRTETIPKLPPVSVSGISLDKNSVNPTVGDTTQIKATVTPSNATNKVVTWKSSDTSVATVDANGKVTAKKAGTATITATTEDGNKIATCKVTVKAKEQPTTKPQTVAVTGIKITPASAELATKKTLQMKVEITPSNATNKAVTWKSSDTSIATVDKNGKVTAIKYGKPVTITATTNDGKKVATAKIQTRFYDVNDKSNQYYWTPVYWAADKNITKGYTDNKTFASDSVYFGPRRDCTRKEMIIFLWRLSGKPSASGSLPFSDTKNMNKSSDGYKAVLWGYKNGIIKGYEKGQYKGQFRPDDAVAKKDTLIMLYRLAKKPKVSGKIKFPDVVKQNYKPTSDTYKAILWGTQKKITNGYKDGNFKPFDNCLREHIVTFIYRYAK